ncbi:MAG: nucleotide exchange factor GrpE, partial [Verrucomicrobiota bacterium]
SATVSNVAQHLKTTQEESVQVVGAAQKLSEKILEEKKAFSEFLVQANDSEKNHLRLEVEKLRRAEMEWLQILIHILDHVFALNQAAERSGKPTLVAQMQQFQSVCRDTARRIGLTAQSPNAQDPFDEKWHQVMEGEAQPQNGAAILETLATGFSFQSRVVRRALVRVQTEASLSGNVGGDPASVADASEQTVREPAPRNESLF